MLDGHSSNYSGNGQSYPQKEVDFLFGNRKKVTGAECDGKSRCWRVTLPFQARWAVAGGDRDTPTFIWADKGWAPVFSRLSPAVWLRLEWSWPTGPGGPVLAPWDDLQRPSAVSHGERCCCPMPMAGSGHFAGVSEPQPTGLMSAHVPNLCRWEDITWERMNFFMSHLEVLVLDTGCSPHFVLWAHIFLGREIYVLLPIKWPAI